MTSNVLWNIVCALLAVSSNAILKGTLQGSLAWKGSMIALMMDFLKILKNPQAWLGITAFIGANLLWLNILATQRMSTAYPLQLSLVFLFSTMISIVIFSERVTSQGVFGMVLVLAGVLLTLSQA